MDTRLKKQVTAVGTATGATAIAVAAVLGNWFEGTGPTKIVESVVYYVPYKDPVGIWTVCRGITAKTGFAVVPGKLYSGPECHHMETVVLERAETAVKKLIVPYPTLTIWAQASLIDFVYNAGETALANSTMRRLFNTGNTPAACREMVKWVNARDPKTQVLIKLPGLVTRREATMEMCLNWKQSWNDSKPTFGNSYASRSWYSRPYNGPITSPSKPTYLTLTV